MGKKDTRTFLSGTGDLLWFQADLNCNTAGSSKEIKLIENL